MTSSFDFTLISLPSPGVNGARPLLESPVELPTGLCPRLERLFANGRWGINDGWNGTLTEGKAGTRCERASVGFTAEMREEERGRPDLYSSVTEGESGIEWMRGTGGMREELRDDRAAEETDNASDLSF